MNNKYRVEMSREKYHRIMEMINILKKMLIAIEYDLELFKMLPAAIEHNLDFIGDDGVLFTITEPYRESFLSALDEIGKHIKDFPIALTEITSIIRETKQGETK